MLNQEYEWQDVRYQINRRISYDVDLSFNGRPVKEQLRSGTPLYRLDFPVFFAVFMKVWWMKEQAFHHIFHRASLSPSDLRHEWQNSLALRKPGKGEIGKLGGRTGEAAPRTQVLVIVTTQPLFAWVGTASPLFHKSGGEEQVYLPNLAQGSGPNRSEYARLLRTYTLPAG
jgi:hypothetical protein